MRDRARLFCVLFVGGMFAVLCGTAASAITYRTVFATDTPSLNPPQSLVFPDRAAQIDAAGRVAFYGSTSEDGSTGIWSEKSGSLVRVVPMSGIASGVSGDYRDDVEMFALNQGGDIAFLGTSAEGKGTWLHDASGFHFLTSPSMGTPLLPRPAGQVPRYSESGKVVFNGYVSGSTASDTGIWSGDRSLTDLIAREGDLAPGTNEPFGDLFRAGSSWFPAVNSEGEVAFRANLSDQPGLGGTMPSGKAGIWAEREGELQLVVRDGAVAPNSSGATFSAFGMPAINTHGQVAFAASTLGAGEGIWSDSSGEMGRIAHYGMQAPGANSGTFFLDLGKDGPLGPQIPPHLSDSGQITFFATLFGPGSGGDNTGIWSGTAGDLSLVIRAGDQAPGTTEGIEFFNVRPTYRVNGSSHIAILSDLNGTGVTNSNSTGLWAQNSEGVLQLVARKGDTFEVGPGDARTVFSIQFDAPLSQGAESGRGTPFNDDHQLAFGLTFTDGTFGVFVADLNVISLRGDFNRDGSVDAADYTVWRDRGGEQSEYDEWRDNFGATSNGVAALAMVAASVNVPEPGVTLLLWSVVSVGMLARKRV